MNREVLFIGNLGMLGRFVAEKLKADGFDVTVMFASPREAEDLSVDELNTIEGDVTSPESLKRPVERKEFICINLNAPFLTGTDGAIEIKGTENIARIAKELGVARICMISSALSKGVEQGVSFLDIMVKAERTLIDSGVPYTIMRPSWFFESLPLFVRKGRAVIIGKQRTEFRWLSAGDYARQLSAALQKEEAANKCFYNLGPQRLSMKQALSKFCEYHYPELKVEEISLTKAKIASKMPRMRKLKRSLPVFEYFSKVNEDIDSTETDRILGLNTTTLDEWIGNWTKPE